MDCMPTEETQGICLQDKIIYYLFQIGHKKIVVTHNKSHQLLLPVNQGMQNNRSFS